MTIDEILEAAEKATPGPWNADIRVGCIAVYPGNPLSGCIDNGMRRLAYFSGKELKNPDGTFDRWTVDEQDGYDAILISGAPQLATEVRRLREWKKVLTEALEAIRDCGGGPNFHDADVQVARRALASGTKEPE